MRVRLGLVEQDLVSCGLIKHVCVSGVALREFFLPLIEGTYVASEEGLLAVGVGAG